VKVDFADKKLAKDCADDRSRMRAFGRDRAKKLKLRLSSLVAAHSLHDLRNAPGRIHELRGDLAGRFAADLDGPYRLVFEPVISKEEKADHANGFDWCKITHVSIIAIEDYHG
jgi:proteic killer suppression protein